RILPPCWIGLLRDKGVPYRIARAGMAWDPSPGVRVEVLSPPPGGMSPGGMSPGGMSPGGAAPEELLHGTRSDLNSNSVVLRISYGRVSFLLAGDIERETEEGLLRNVPDKLRSTVLKVAHHGSKYSTGERFLEAVCPDYAVVQVGRNSFGHPDAQTLARLKGFGAKTMVTLADGAVTAITDGSDLRVATLPVGK
ncbi:MAG: hypothetical protein M1598_04205, partial [Actinobacteria bacterium]|nr:hypothetical protein [Actinomycetota bacterium]